MRRAWLGLLILPLLTACAANKPFPEAEARRDVLPAEVIGEPDRFDGAEVLWGGRVVALHNQAESTRLEVLAYPLDGSDRPATGSPADRRFLVRVEGFLEPQTYQQGRLVTVLGRLDGTVTGKVGEAEYVYPLLRAERVHLWPLDSEPVKPKVRFSIGIGIFR